MAAVVIIENSAIKGYHIFKIKPHPLIKMLVVNDIQNPKDENAMLVKMPPLDDIPSRLHQDVTRKKKGAHEKDQTVDEIADEIVGRVPANLCRVFRELIKQREVEKIEW